VVWTVTAVPRREELADRRLRLATYVRALEGADAVVAAGDDVREGLRRWLGVDAPVVPLLGAAEEYAALYERVARSRT
jgi:hypothetical protein